jgi:hypothetical protein
LRHEKREMIEAVGGMAEQGKGFAATGREEAK